MSNFVALLRGINVGGRIIKMADLKTCFDNMGFKNVATILQTGNVIFEANSSDTAIIKQKIEAGLSKRFDYPAKAQVYKAENIKKIIQGYPFDLGQTQFQHYVIFLETGLAKELAEESLDLDAKIEMIKESDTVIYWQVKKGMTVSSPFSKYLTKSKYKQGNTVRNISTLNKLLK